MLRLIDLVSVFWPFRAKRIYQNFCRIWSDPHDAGYFPVPGFTPSAHKLSRDSLGSHSSVPLAWSSSIVGNIFHHRRRKAKAGGCQMSLERSRAKTDHLGRRIQIEPILTQTGFDKL
jgi:hypothetical protein